MKCRIWLYHNPTKVICTEIDNSRSPLAWVQTPLDNIQVDPARRLVPKT